ncbi:MAG: hypothetical protein ACTSRZ_06565 [Promethearchaeota archaeon]
MNEKNANLKNKNLLFFRNLLREFFQLVLHTALLLFCAGYLWWLNAWINAVISLIYEIINFAILSKKIPLS